MCVCVYVFVIIPKKRDDQEKSKMFRTLGVQISTKEKIRKKQTTRNKSQVEIVRQSQIGHCTHSLNEYSGICHLIALVVGSSRYLDMEQENDRPNKWSFTLKWVQKSISEQ